MYRSLIVDCLMVTHTLLKSFILVVRKNFDACYCPGRLSSVGTPQTPVSATPTTPSKTKSVRDIVKKMIDDEMATMEGNATDTPETPTSAVAFVTTEVVTKTEDYPQQQSSDNQQQPSDTA